MELSLLGKQILQKIDTFLNGNTSDMKNNLTQTLIGYNVSSGNGKDFLSLEIWNTLTGEEKRIFDQVEEVFQK